MLTPHSPLFAAITELFRVILLSTQVGGKESTYMGTVTVQNTNGSLLKQESNLIRNLVFIKATNKTEHFKFFLSCGC